MGKNKLWFFLMGGTIVVIAAVWILLWEDQDHVIGPKINEPAIQKDNDPSSINQLDENIKKLEGSRETLAPKSLFVSGVVLNKETAAPVQTFNLSVWRRVDKAWDMFQEENIDDEQGRFHIPLSQGGKIRCWVRNPGFYRFHMDLTVPEDQGLSDVRFLLDPGASMNGVVVDHETNEPVKGAKIIRYKAQDHVPYAELFVGDPSRVTHAVSDKEGRFCLSGQRIVYNGYHWEREGWRIAAYHPSYAVGVLVTPFKQNKTLEIRLKHGACFYGTVCDDEGAPKEGVMVSVSFPDAPAARAVLSGPDGAYRTAPVQPGKIFLHAGPPPRVESSTLNFTVETKILNMGTADQEVNFGLEKRHVNWLGVLYDAMGEPMPKTAIELEPGRSDLREKLEHPMTRKTFTDSKGCFEFKKLNTDTYLVSLKPTYWAHNIDMGDIAFDLPGVVERDLRVTGAQVHGQVVDKHTGEPVTREKWCWVSTNTWQPRYRHFSCPTDQEGGFQLVGLPEGNFTLSVSARGYPHTMLPDFFLKKDETKSNMVIRLNASGKMELTLEGFPKNQATPFVIVLGPEDGRKIEYGPYNMPLEGQHVYNRELSGGLWFLRVQFEGLGMAERKIKIIPGKTIKLSIHRDDLTLSKGEVSIVGTLNDHSGEPMPGIKLSFYGKNAPGKNMKDKFKECVVDKEGRFYLEGLCPGTWTCTAILGDGVFRNFTDLELPISGQNPYPLDLTLSLGGVLGKILDGITEKELGKKIPIWWLFLRNVETKLIVIRTRSKSGPDIKINGVPEGKYQLTLKVKGYQDLELPPFELSKGEVKDLGALRVMPSGQLLLKLTTKTGQPVDNFKTICNGHTIFIWQWDKKAPGQYQSGSLPVGPVTLAIKAEGFKEEVVKVNLLAEQIKECVLVLEEEG